MTHSCPTRRSSDLQVRPQKIRLHIQLLRIRLLPIWRGCAPERLTYDPDSRQGGGPFRSSETGPHSSRDRLNRAIRSGRFKCVRSEEHTSELQSLMRISYAIFCLQKIHKTEK